MTTPTDALPQLNRNLNILREREAKFGGNAPRKAADKLRRNMDAAVCTGNRPLVIPVPS